jgi:hypothetical protein
MRLTKASYTNYYCNHNFYDKYGYYSHYNVIVTSVIGIRTLTKCCIIQTEKADKIELILLLLLSEFDINGCSEKHPNVTTG